MHLPENIEIKFRSVNPHKKKLFKLNLEQFEWGSIRHHDVNNYTEHF